MNVSPVENTSETHHASFKEVGGLYCSFIAGGLLSLYIGFSFLTLIEFLFGSADSYTKYAKEGGIENTVHKCCRFVLPIMYS